jgi:hypothetical protein
MVSPVATTKAGRLRGRGEPGVLVCQGIRYATASRFVRRSDRSRGPASATRKPMRRPARDTIAASGGDPGNVTTFGFCGGGLKVSALLVMPAARGGHPGTGGEFGFSPHVDGVVFPGQPEDLIATAPAPRCRC